MSDPIYDPKVVESRWSRWWEETGTNQIDLYAAKNPYYVLMMFPYPSAEGLHVGNVFAFTGADIQGRYRRLRGYDVFEPIGFDAFGIHSENFAMKVGRHPAELIPSNIANFTQQLRMMGLMYDWRRTVDTTSPQYYRWTQWIFLQLYKAGLAYRDTKEVNFCPKCGTVISDEQVVNGACERHDDTPVERRALPCWFFRITEFAPRLYANLDWIDWSEKTRLAQRNWIGASQGAEVDFPVVGRDAKIRVFTTRPDTLFGATYMVMAPDHPLVDQITPTHRRAEVAAYRERAAAAKAAGTEPADAASKAKTGVDTGARAINPVNGEHLPIFVSDYVLMGYGTGAIMAVPAHDERDFAFARAHQLPIRCVIRPAESALSAFAQDHALPGTAPNIEAIREEILRGLTCWSGDGVGMNSANREVSLNDLAVDEAKATICRYLETRGLGTPKTTYRLRDWGISRQRYWGPPIPIIYDEEGNAHPVPEDQLPVTLPPLTDFRPKGDGRGPLANVPEWVNTTLPDGRPGRRETDVMDNFLDSAWYYLRYISSADNDRAWDPELIRKWLPVDLYIGGNEHAVLHLLYTRFICMALEKAGALSMPARPDMKDTAEPFRQFRAHGLLIRSGSKMSKSKGNVVNPDAFVEEYGADTVRMYLMFLGPYLYGGDFRDSDIQGVRRFLNRLYLWYYAPDQPRVADAELPREVLVKLHQTIKKVAADIEALSYNTAIAALMELHNALKAAPARSRFAEEALVLMLAPFAPFLAEELWQGALKQNGSVFNARYPDFDPALTVMDEIEIALQVNGRIRDRVMVPRTADKPAIEAIALANEAVKSALGGKTPEKVVVVPGRLVNIIVK